MKKENNLNVLQEKLKILQVQRKRIYLKVKN
ncbi:hypothetical protein CIB43_00282 [Mesomycoplasma hyopneumoniae]|uniref:Uncharacterized protein n=1 Tax=Mesomycoplasma hyopneumoniae TaxID=2099 RepID=A0A223M9J1_MESHO|nr:hypothetical protein CIB43_00282 [Mesomycoplasma hyopneumoniae]